MKHLSDYTVLNNGVQMPWIGLGVYQAAEGDQVEHAVMSAIQDGYRSIDTASIYGNEEGVGRAVKACGVPREQLFITTKVWNSDQGYDATLSAFETSLKKLGMDYIDLYLVHWAVKDKYKDTWRAMEKLYQEGKVRAIGVSNFQIHHLEDLMEDCKIVPAVNQVEFHPRLTQAPLLAYCQKHHIQMEAWSPLMQGKLLDDPTLLELGRKYGKSPAQIILRWDLHKGVVAIPKSITPVRIRENANIFDFDLSKEEIARLDELNRNERAGADPDNFNF